MRALALLIALIVPGVAAAQPLVVSPGPERVSVSVYRARADAPINRDDPAGFALITETRTIAIPAGRAVIRFEGVAGNIFPETAIVSGLPAGVREKNLDADLLSPRALFDRSLGRRVLIRRTDARGRVREEQAVLRSAADGAAVLTLGQGVEALRCSGLKESIVYPAVPEGLSAKPTLSVETDSARAVTATVTLAYLAGGFDWEASYTLRLAPDRAHADLFAWVTIASTDVTQFDGAETQAIAGRVERDAGAAFTPPEGQQLRLRCWPAAAPYGATRMFSVPPPPPPPPVPMMMAAPPAIDARAMDIVVTGTVRRAREEALGDLKLYRLPDAVTIAPQSTKQVALMDVPAIKVALVYESRIFDDRVAWTHLLLRARNRKADGLGRALPAGGVIVLTNSGDRELLLGEARTEGKAIDEEVELDLGSRPSVNAQVSERDTDDWHPDRQPLRLTLFNGNAWPIAYEARFDLNDDQAIRSATRLGRKDGKPIWRVTVPANGTATLDYLLIERR